MDRLQRSAIRQTNAQNGRTFGEVAESDARKQWPIEPHLREHRVTNAVLVLGRCVYVQNTDNISSFSSDERY